MQGLFTPSAFISMIFCAFLTRPATIRPMAIRPTYSEKSSVVQSIWSGPSGSTSGPGTFSTSRSSSGLMSPEVAWASCEANPPLPEAKMYGKSSWCSSAPSSTKQSKTSLRTSSGRASGRSILLITTIGRILLANALRSTNLVCGIGPSNASTSTRAPSAICKVRSTSPPKSAWPGVSMMLILVLPWLIAMFFARMVIPRSRSWGLESRMQSWLSVPARNWPDWRSITSTRVVLPWSTWAMIATFRMSSRRIMGSSPPGNGAGQVGKGESSGRLDALGKSSISGLHALSKGDRLAGVPLSILDAGHFCFQNASHSGPAAKAPNSTSGATCSTRHRAPVCFILTFSSCLIEPSTSPLPID